MTGVEYVRDLCKQKGIAISKLEKDLGFSNGYLNPKKMDNIPYDRALLIYKYLGGDLNIMTGTDTVIGEEMPYYLNDETREIAQEIFDNPDLKSLFDMSRKMSPERLKAHIEFMKNLQNSESGSDT
jgi:transcriptional regulator with XRE-family HTH domain